MRGNIPRKVYRIDVAFNTDGNSPWDAVWYGGEDQDLQALCGQLRLAPIWKAPNVTVKKRKKKPDIYGFQLFLAVSESARILLEPLVGVSAEFLPLECKAGGVLYAIHPLRFVDLDDNAVVTRNVKDPTSNITVVGKYSFSAEQYDPEMHLFGILQGKGSSSRDAGYTLGDVIVSQEVKDLCDANDVKGVIFKEIWSG